MKSKLKAEHSRVANPNRESCCEGDFYSELSLKQKALIDKALVEVEQGQTTSYEDVLAELIKD